MARRKRRPRDVPSARRTLRQMTPQNEENLPVRAHTTVTRRERPPLSLRHAVPAPKCLIFLQSQRLLV
jgi:hypothetical protein